METLFVENGKPLIFGQNNEKGVKLDGFKPVIVNMADHSADDLWVHDETDRVKAGILSRFFDNPRKGGDHFPRPFGVFYTEARASYEDGMNQQITDTIAQKGEGDLDKLLRGRDTWEIV